MDYHYWISYNHQKSQVPSYENFDFVFYFSIYQTFYFSKESAKLRALLALVPTRLTHHYYALYVTCEPCAPYALASLRAFTFINKRLTQLATNTVVSVGTRVKKFNLARNDHGHTQRCEFSLLDRIHHLWANLAQKIKIVSLS